MRTDTGSSAAPPELVSNVIQLALFGDPVPVFEEPPRRTAAQDAAVDEVLASVQEFDDQLDLLLDGFPDEERHQAQSLVYLSADGTPATRHGLLRVV